MSNKTKVEANEGTTFVEFDKKILLGLMVLIGFIFMIGYLSNNKKSEDVIFTKSDVEAINTAIETYGDDVEVSKEDGNLVIRIATE